MKKVVFLLFFLVALAAPKVFSQNKPSETFVLYDPLFWKQQLRLSAPQRQEIMKINADFYTELLTESADIKNPVMLRQWSANLLQERSDKIWSVFSNRQKHKWMKLESGFDDSRSKTSLSKLFRKSFPSFHIVSAKSGSVGRS
jgi:hypothetical protein